MKTVLVTGSKGFIGKALVKKLQAIGFNTVGFNSEDGDIEDTDLSNKFSDSNIDYIFHLASKTFVPDSWENPMEFYRNIVIGTGQVLELARKKNIPMTFVSSYLYGVPEELPIKEDSKIKPNNPYAHAKFLAEEACRFYSEFYKVKISIARPFNVYGKDQNDIFLIPSLLKQAKCSEKICVKTLFPKRDYLYIEDLIEGLIKTMESKNNFSVYNFGSGKELSVLEVIHIIQKCLGVNKEIVSENIERKNEIMNVIADISKANTELDWFPKFEFEDGIRNII